MKKMKKNASIVLALVIAVLLIVPFVLGATNNDTTTPAVEAEITDAPANTVVEDELADVPADIIVEDELVDVGHICTIKKANERRHIVDCDECGNYQNVRHRDLKKETVNSFFHIQSCVCGYTYTEQHDFATAFNADYHYDVCIDCGYSAPAEEHNLCDTFINNEHYIECDTCAYMAERHIGVDYAQANENTNAGCYAFCPACNMVELVDHEWDGFMCENCQYTKTGLTVGIIERIWYSSEGFTVRIDVNGTNHIIDLNNVNFEEGDCVVIEHYGNDIWDVRVMVEYDICDNPENIPVYVAEIILAEMAYENYDSNTIDDVEIYDDGTAIIDFVDGSFLYVENAIVYDFENGNAVDIQWVCEDERIVWFYVDDQLVILDYYW